MKFQATLGSLLILAGAVQGEHEAPWNRRLKRQVTVTVSGPAAVPSSSATAPAPISATSSGPVPAGTGANCGKGYTYCGYMLQTGGHNFAQDIVHKAYCDALPSGCTNGVPKTDANQAVYLCMQDSPASIQLMCACSGKCLNEKASNNIAHCDKACNNGDKCL
ncbi:uncharacterized protein BCR38DRAFT_480515 [Pseudomassariella vexata]|uniref:Uncharacterized protein n=1 Tax=Pseudomassariella vexata TaxID=1141098 RepID=A0A1Y2EMI2_9PEZI|nr:uncharacterized protein BCR38DRAFT_480515 [Pseudomassariella vexata]ORY72045.1 hypothetical protein BCR38DRAFT_480515 [Pseudomassariella vexata]